VGKRADVAIISGAAPNLQPLYSNAQAADIVYSATGRNVRATIVDGRVLYLDGCFTTIDVGRLKAAVQRQRARVEGWMRANRGGKVSGGAAKAAAP